ncbi:hypothetical protein MTP99_000416 [Tenebrio molitor]|nr:hypothetical protein MTP99_000416 [Tenebrio molitor]
MNGGTKMGVPNDRDTNAKLTPSGKNSGTKDTSPGVPLEVANTWCTRGGLIRRCQYRVSQHNDYCSRESARYHRGISSRGTASAARKEVLDEVEGPEFDNAAPIRKLRVRSELSIRFLCKWRRICIVCTHPFREAAAQEIRVAFFDDVS